ncbi:hypothetical protein MTR_4g065430 [Medicago truncatula]|uniref:Uncharacterized protein n=1 Tax=Medicago truncatula TaxID=3880 RepID=G7JDM5_MEDTR|nr:hypothetical protein MTR_4g065430 [Medicago truncatula]
MTMTLASSTLYDSRGLMSKKRVILEVAQKGKTRGDKKQLRIHIHINEWAYADQEERNVTSIKISPLHPALIAGTQLKRQ